MARETIEDALQSFERTKYFTSHALTPQSFDRQMNLLVENIQRTVPESYQRTFNLIKTNYEVNQFMTPINSDFNSLNDEGLILWYSMRNRLSKKGPDCLLTSNDVFSCYSIPVRLDDNVIKTSSSMAMILINLFRACLKHGFLFNQFYIQP